MCGVKKKRSRAQSLNIHSNRFIAGNKLSDCVKRRNTEKQKGSVNKFTKPRLSR